MININDLELVKNDADKIVKDYKFNTIFDHYGLKVPNKEIYDELCSKLGQKHNEVILSNRRVATVIGKEGVFEILEPKSDEVVESVFLDHLSYRTDEFSKAKDLLEDIIAEFDFGKTKGIKIKVNNIIIEIRNDKLIDSKID